jgi:hypothetical protein
MNIYKIAFLFIITFLVSVPGWCDPVEELLEIDQKLVALRNSPDTDSLQLEGKLKIREAKAFRELFHSKDALEKFVNKADDFSPALVKRFVGHLQFEINQEKRNDLKHFLDEYQKTWEDESSWVKGKKKIAYIYGYEVNLRDGEWRHTPDGKRFWVSNEYPEIILSPAEYRRYSQSATVVEY